MGDLTSTILRSGLLLSSLLLYYASLPRLDLSMAAAVYYTILLFAAIGIREAVGIQGWVGVAIGFTGVLVMLKPQAGDLNIAALLPLLSAMLYALGMAITRTRSHREHPLVLSPTLNLIAIGVAGAATWYGASGGSAAQSLFVGDWIAMGWTE